MSFLGDTLGFENFHLKDLWKGIKKDPKRLVLGVDPMSTKVWNKALNRDDEPLVDQMGGAYGGHTLSAFGNNDGGVYKRAEDAGINTGPGKKMQDLAHVVAALYGGKGLSDIGGSGGSSSPFGFGESMQTPSFGGTQGINPMAGGGSAAPTGGGMGSGMDWQQFASMPQQQQQDPNAAQREREERKKRQMLAQLLRELGTRNGNV